MDFSQFPTSPELELSLCLIEDRWLHFHGKSQTGLPKSKNLSDLEVTVIQALSGADYRLPYPTAGDREVGLLLFDLRMHAYAELRERYWGNEATVFTHDTILDAAWSTGDRKPKVQLPAISQKSRRALSVRHDNFIGVVELQAFANAFYEDAGNLITPHVHAQCWGQRADVGRKIMNRISNRFSPPFPDVETYQSKVALLRDFGDIARVGAYGDSAHAKCKTYYKPRDPAKRANLHESTVSDRYIRYLRMFQILSMIGADRMLFASGEGTHIRADIVRSLKIRVKEAAGRTRPVIAFAEIPDFWAEFNERHGLGRFKPPLIVQ